MTAGGRRRKDPAKKHGGRRPGAGRRAGGATKTSQPIGLRISLDAIARAEAAGQTIGQRVDLALEILAANEDAFEHRRNPYHPLSIWVNSVRR